MNEQEATDKLESLVGGSDKAFRLMRIYESAKNTTSGEKFSLRMRPRTVESVFTDTAVRNGYSAEAISHYLNHIR